MQETLLAALRNKHTFAGQSTERTWLIGILRKKIVDLFRKQARERQVDDQWVQANFASEVFDTHGHWKTRVRAWPRDAAESISKREFWRVFEACSTKLPDGVCGAFMLRDVEGLTTGEICKILGITATNLGARLHRARMWLRVCLEENWFLREKKGGS